MRLLVLLICGWDGYFFGFIYHMQYFSEWVAVGGNGNIWTVLWACEIGHTWMVELRFETRICGLGFCTRKITSCSL
jgi:hypothetical protein